jgi:hypothetical protein
VTLAAPHVSHNRTRLPTSQHSNPVHLNCTKQPPLLEPVLSKGRSKMALKPQQAPPAHQAAAPSKPATRMTLRQQLRSKLGKLFKRGSCSGSSTSSPLPDLAASISSASVASGAAADEKHIAVDDCASGSVRWARGRSSRPLMLRAHRQRVSRPKAVPSARRLSSDDGLSSPASTNPCNLEVDSDDVLTLELATWNDPRFQESLQELTHSQIRLLHDIAKGGFGQVRAILTAGPGLLACLGHAAANHAAKHACSCYACAHSNATCCWP